MSTTAMSLLDMTISRLVGVLESLLTSSTSKFTLGIEEIVQAEGPEIAFIK